MVIMTISQLEAYVSGRYLEVPPKAKKASKSRTGVKNQEPESASLV